MGRTTWKPHSESCTQAHNFASCAKQGSHVRLCLHPSGTCGREPETLRRRVGFITSTDHWTVLAAMLTQISMAKISF